MFVQSVTQKKKAIYVLNFDSPNSFALHSLVELNSPKVETPYFFQKAVFCDVLEPKRLGNSV